MVPVSVFIAETGTCCYHRLELALRTIFLFSSLVSSFLLFLPCFSLCFHPMPVSLSFFVLPRSCSSYLFLLGTCAFRLGALLALLSPCVICILFHFRTCFILSFLFLFFGSARVAVFSYPIRYASHLLYPLICVYFVLVFLCFTVCDHRICISLGLGIRTGTGCTDVVE